MTNKRPPRRASPPSTDPGRPAPPLRGSVALRHRIPNPPPVFVGRRDELERARAAVERGPLTVLWGPGGLGKSALVCELLTRHFAPRLERAVIVAMRPGDSVEQIESETLRAPAGANGFDASAFDDEVYEPHAALATLIDLAERRSHIVVLEDLHHESFEEVRTFLATIGRYARSSRWIVATREDPGLPEIAEQILAVPAMPEGDLLALAESIGASAAVSAEMVRDARGSPWRMRQLLGGSRLLDEEDLLVHVSPGARRLLERTLAACHGELAMAGLSPRLWDLLDEHAGTEALRGIRLHVAVAVGTEEALAWAVSQEAPAPHDDRLGHRFGAAASPDRISAITSLAGRPRLRPARTLSTRRWISSAHASTS